MGAKGSVEAAKMNSDNWGHIEVGWIRHVCLLLSLPLLLHSDYFSTVAHRSLASSPLISYIEYEANAITRFLPARSDWLTNNGHKCTNVHFKKYIEPQLNRLKVLPMHLPRVIHRNWLLASLHWLFIFKLKNYKIKVLFRSTRTFSTSQSVNYNNPIYKVE